MKQRLKSLRIRILLPVIILAVFVVTLLNTVFTRGYIQIILQQEQKVNAVGFSAVSNSAVPLMNATVSEARSILSNDQVAAYARLQYASESELIHARIRCRDSLKAEIASRERIYGLLFMRKDGSLFGTLPEANLFLDVPEDNPLPEDLQKQILEAPLGQTVWVGPVTGASLYGFENAQTPKRVMIAAWKSTHVSYGECYTLMLMDESILDDLFAVLQDGNSDWYLFTADQTEIWRTGPEPCGDPEKLIRESNSGGIYRDEDGHIACAFSMTMESTGWTLVRQVSMESARRTITSVVRSIVLLGAAVLLIVLIIYRQWLKRFMLQFQSLLKGVVRIGKGDLESSDFVPTSIEEFNKMQREIDRTRLALRDQMDTIRQMEREQMELENRQKEQERIAEELALARQIQISALPRIFPAYPDRTEFALFASMDPAKEVGGDFFDFFLIDDDHLALVIADVSGKGIPAAMFMMTSKSLIRNELMADRDPAEALMNVNLQLFENNDAKMFVTVWVAILELSTGKGLACNAGHEHPALRRAGEAFELIQYKHGIMVGISRKARYQNREFELHPGDSIFVYTDGVPEAKAGNKEMFGAERLVTALNSCQDCRPDEVLTNVKRAVDAFVGDAEQFDDLTMMCLEYKGPGTITDGGFPD